MPYKITRLEYLKQTIAALDDDYSKQWSDYPCVEWPYARVGKNINRKYGVVSMAKGISVSAHRAALSIANPEVDIFEFDVCHHCDNPPCFRPIHLFSGSRQDNVDDMMRKGRYGIRAILTGEENHTSVLTWDSVYEIHGLRNAGLSQDKIAARIGVSQATIGSVLRGEKWKTPLIPVLIGTRASRAFRIG